jgi:uncharacterized phage protein (predicted DNA packaging)
MKLSTITLDVVKEYLRIDHDVDDALLMAILNAARSYVLHYTGLEADEADDYNDLVVACLVVCADMYDNRTMSAENAAENKVATSIMNLHARNLV